MSINNEFQVKWTKTATLAFAKLFNVDHDSIAIKANTKLSRDPFKNSNGIADYPNFKFNGFHWTDVNNTILVYSIDEKRNSVRIQACFSSLTGYALKVFYKEHDPM